MRLELGLPSESIAIQIMDTRPLTFAKGTPAPLYPFQ